jgi:hypothetical protein
MERGRTWGGCQGQDKNTTWKKFKNLTNKELYNEQQLNNFIT